MKQQTTNHRQAAASATFPLAAFALATLLAGCSSALPSGTTVNTLNPALGHITGHVFGGQQPVAGATIQLYTVGTSGLKSASTGLIATPPTTDVNGNFSITGLYSCTGTTPGTEVYLVATGGNPGAGTNGNLSLVAALGSCATLLANAASTTVIMNEVTTVAAAYALAPFATDLTHIGASGSAPTGMVNAFANAAALANTSAGAAGGASLPAGTTAPVAELNTLANILASCVNTTGSASSACTMLFAATSATDTFGAALAIAKSPGASAITALYMLSSSTAPFQPSMTLGSAPNDFSVALSYTGGGALATPYAVAIDASGNAWIANETGTAVTELSPTGSVLASPTATGLVGAEGIAVDRSGNVWVANTAGNSVVKFTVTSGSVTATSSFTAGGIAAPSAIALDSASNAWIANFNGNSITELSSTGASQSGSPLTGSGGNITVPTGIAVTKTGNVYVTSGQGDVVAYSNSAGYLGVVTDNALQGPVAIAIDPNTGNGVFTGSLTGSSVTGGVTEVLSGGTISPVSPVNGGLTVTGGVASDGTSFWVADSAASGGLVQLTFGSATSVSPGAGFGSLNTPVGVAVDGSGSVWTTNSGSNTVSQFIGLGAPVTTPIAANVGP